MKGLSNEAKRVRIAEICGWKWIYKKGTWHHARLIDPNGRSPVQHGFGGTPTERKVKKLLKEWPIHHIPDYLNDLNAMAEAEKVLNRDQAWKYRGVLQDMVVAQQGSLGAVKSIDFIYGATARQRAEAFLACFPNEEEK